MRMNPFESQLERLARTLTERFGVTVICQGDSAYTDGRRIVLPSLPEPMDESLERMVVGYLDHEMSHVAFSDFKVVAEFAARHPGRKDLLNVVEDALIERRAMQRWPGVRANLDSMFRQVRGRVAAILKKADPFRRFCTAIYLELSHHNDMMGLESELEGYEDLLDGFPGVNDTHDSAELAAKLSQRWTKRNPPQANPKPQDDDSGDQPFGDEESSGDQVDDQADAESAPPSDQEPNGTDVPSDDSSDEDQSNRDESPRRASTDGEEPSQEPGTDGGDASDDDNEASESQAGKPDPNETSAYQTPSGTEQADSNDGSDSSAEEDASSQIASNGQGGGLIGEIVAEAIAEAVSRVDTSEQYRVFTKKEDHLDVVPNANDRDVSQLLATGADTVRRLRRGLANALRSAEKRWWREDQNRGVLSPRTLHRICFDQPSLNVFRTRAMVQGRSTAVCIVLDASGSMTSQKMAVARDSMRVLLEALHDLKIPTEAFTFTTGHGVDLLQAAQAMGLDPTDLRYRFSRFGNLEIGLIKRFEEPVKIALRRLPSIKGTGLTPLGEAMEIGARRLVVRPELRKIMLALTDGKAGCECNSQAAHNHAQHVAEKITQTGIELVGVGIMDDSLCDIVTDTIVVHQLQDLPTRLCKLLGRTLKKGMRHVG